MSYKVFLYGGLTSLALVACGGGDGNEDESNEPKLVDCSSASATVSNGQETRAAQEFSVRRAVWTCTDPDDLQSPVFWHLRFSAEQDADTFKFNEVRLNVFVPDGLTVAQSRDVTIGSIRDQRVALLGDTPPATLSVWGTPASPHAGGIGAQTNTMASGTGTITRLEAEEGGCFAGTYEVGPVSAQEPVYLSGEFVLPVEDVNEEPDEEFLTPVQCDTSS